MGSVINLNLSHRHCNPVTHQNVTPQANAKDLRDLANKIEKDASVQGLVVIIDRGGDDLELMAMGRYNKAKERIAVLLHKVAHWIIHED